MRIARSTYEPPLTALSQQNSSLGSSISRKTSWARSFQNLLALSADVSLLTSQSQFSSRILRSPNPEQAAVEALMLKVAEAAHSGAGSKSGRPWTVVCFFFW